MHKTCVEGPECAKIRNQCNANAAHQRSSLDATQIFFYEMAHGKVFGTRCNTHTHTFMSVRWSFFDFLIPSWYGNCMR